MHKAGESGDAKRVRADKINDKTARYLLMRRSLLLNGLVIDKSVESGATSNSKERLNPKQVMDQKYSDH
jgi:hypothetical protein